MKDRRGETREREGLDGGRGKRRAELSSFILILICQSVVSYFCSGVSKDKASERVGICVCVC